MTTIPMIILVTLDSFIIHSFIATKVVKRKHTLILLSAANISRVIFTLSLFKILHIGGNEIYFSIVLFSPLIWMIEFFVLYKLCESYFPPLMIIVTNLALLQLSFIFLDMSIFFDIAPSDSSLNSFVYIQPLILLLLLFISHKINLKYGVLSHLFNLKKKYKTFSLITFIFFILVFSSLSLTTRIISNLDVYIYTSLLIYITLIFLYVLLYKTVQQNEQSEQFQLQVQAAFYTKDQIEITQEFRHDYKAILINISDSLNQGNLLQARQQLNEVLNYSKPVLNTNYYDQLVKLRLPTIQNLLFNFLQTCNEHNISIELSIRQQIDNVDINIIDLSRCISILCNNAFEAVSGISSGKIKITINSTSEQFTFSIENTIIDTINLSEVLKKGHTTKDTHQGYGLHIFAKILRQYKNTQYVFNVEDKCFIASFSIVKN